MSEQVQRAKREKLAFFSDSSNCKCRTTVPHPRARLLNVQRDNYLAERRGHHVKLLDFEALSIDVYFVSHGKLASALLTFDNSDGRYLLSNALSAHEICASTGIRRQASVPSRRTPTASSNLGPDNIHFQASARLYIRCCGSSVTEIAKKTKILIVRC